LPQIGDTKYNSGHAKLVWAACDTCGRERWVKLKHGQPQNLKCIWCSHKARFQVAHEKGKRCKDGYILILLKPDDFFFSMTQSGGYVFQHRLVIAKSLNRCLHAWEVVHHKNSIRDDNRLENLELISDKRFHLVETTTKNQIRRLESRVKDLEARVTLLEAENTLLKARDASPTHSG